MVRSVHILTYNSPCLLKWTKKIKTTNEIENGKLQMANVQIKEISCVSTFVSARNPFSLLINIKQFSHNTMVIQFSSQLIDLASML